MAALSPAGPPPTIHTSTSSVTRSTVAESNGSRFSCLSGEECRKRVLFDETWRGIARRRAVAGRTIIFVGEQTNPLRPDWRQIHVRQSQTWTHKARVGIGIFLRISPISHSLPRIKQSTSCSKTAQTAHFPPPWCSLVISLERFKFRMNMRWSLTSKMNLIASKCHVHRHISDVDPTRSSSTSTNRPK